MIKLEESQYALGIPQHAGLCQTTQPRVEIRLIARTPVGRVSRYLRCMGLSPRASTLPTIVS
jgi:hypothetical protein